MKRGEDDEDSVFVVADKVFRMQVEWMVQHTGVRQEFPAVMRKIWWSYLTAALPDVTDGVEQVLLSNPVWMQSLRHVDLAQLVDIPQQLLKSFLLSWEKTAFPEAEDVTKKVRHSTLHTKLPPNRQTRNFEVRLSHQRLVALMALGLLLCGENTLISDLLRWIRTLQFPYVSPPLTSEEFANYNRLNEHHTIYVPACPEIEWLMAMMARTLKLKQPDFPAVGVASTVVRYVEELNLPRAMSGFVMGVAQAVHTSELLVNVEPGSFRGGRHRSQGVEGFAMACVVYAMRIMFGMDGESEMRITEATGALQELIDANVCLFDFWEWVRHMDYRRLQLFRHPHLLSSSSAKADLFLAEAGPVPPAPPRVKTVAVLEAEQKRILIRRLKEEQSGGSSYPVLVLPPSHRPFRAHTEALAEHLLNDQFVPKAWKVAKNKREKSVECWAQLRGAQLAGKNAAPLRAQNWVGDPQTKVPATALTDEVPSFSMRWLLEVCAEIIEHSPERLLREVLLLELALYPGLPSTRFMGKACGAVSKMRYG